ncbi:unnamed protein product [[Candida] boidinii]|uniref:Unnamed protein product n=1 Tax=Candida boidinii TaxID=5477 RepID=A0A9W6SXC5_CANBO|nr:hypothetical protein B5S30_g806 [[Candida] boidinii]GME66848.1 unnamed protein product [[Candida] boidinii]
MVTKTETVVKKEIPTDSTAVAEAQEEIEGPRRITAEELYRRSSQYRIWSFTESQLEDMRVSANKRGLIVRTNKLSSLDKSLPEVQLLFNENGNFEHLTVEEERIIVIYYARKAKDLANFFHLPTQARSTAISFLIRFFLIHSVMEYHPQFIMYTCLFLAAKVENNFIGINTFSKAIPKTTPESILQYEYPILESMKFTLLCRHPYQPLYGFYLDIQAVFPKIDIKRLGTAYDSARSLINDSLFSDAVFLYTPPQIALAALWISDNVVAERYLARKFGFRKKKEKTDNNEQNKNKLTTTKEKKDSKVPIVKQEQSDKIPVKQEQSDRIPVKQEQSDKIPEAKVKEEQSDKIPEDKVKEEQSDKIPDVKVKMEENGVDDLEASADGDSASIMTPERHYKKMMEIIRECAEYVKNVPNPSVEVAKRVSTKVHYCLDPFKYARKLAKQKGITISNATSTPTPGPEVIPFKRPAEDELNDDAKRVKTE